MWGGSAPNVEKLDTEEQSEQSEAGPNDFDENDMNFAERLTAVVGVLFVEKYEYTVDGLYYGGGMIKDWWNRSLSCGYQGE